MRCFEFDRYQMLAARNFKLQENFTHGEVMQNMMLCKRKETCPMTWTLKSWSTRHLGPWCQGRGRSEGTFPHFVFSYTAFASSIHCVKLLPSSSEAESKPLSSELSTNSLVVAAVSGACWKFLTRVISNRKGTLIHEAGECFAPHLPFRFGKGSATSEHADWCMFPSA